MSTATHDTTVAVKKDELAKLLRQVIDDTGNTEGLLRDVWMSADYAATALEDTRIVLDDLLRLVEGRADDE